MRIVKYLWRLLVGGAVTGGGWYMAMGQLEETALTGSAVIGVALIAVGASVLAGAFD